MMKPSQKCKGARDFVPEDMEIFRYIERRFMDCCSRWGYNEVRTPTLEYLHLFTSAGTLTPAMLNKVYSFLDWDGWSGERVVLRPDGTIPVARLFMENMVDQKIAKLFYITNVFSFENTGKENRERWQCGVEYLGSNKPWSDLEIMTLACEVLKNLGLANIQIKLSHAGIIKSLIKGLKLTEDKEEKILDQLRKGKWDLFSKISGENKSKLSQLFINIKGKSTGYLENIKSLPDISPALKSNIDNLASITRMLDALKVPYQIDITSTNDFEYYTGLCFQFMYKNKLVGAGGRYNDLIPLMGGSKIPACGFALYVDPITRYLKLIKSESNNIAILYPQEDLSKAGLYYELVNRLHEAGYAAELGMNQDESNYRYIIKINPKSDSFGITDCLNDKQYKTNSVAGIISLIGGKK